jgi:hypothetical protein
MREITEHKVNEANEALKIQVLDEPGAGNANHSYVIFADESKVVTKPGITVYTQLNFQNGPIKECGVNGVTQEALLAICADRLRSFQSGPYACKENAVALTHIETAQLWLQKRTRERLARGVEGTHEK